MDFFDVSVRETKRGVEIFPSFRVARSKDLMIRGRAFYAIWDEERGVWSTDEYDVARLVDQELYKKRDELKDVHPHVLSMTNYNSRSWTEYKNYLARAVDCSNDLDQRVIFENSKTTREDYSSKNVPYAITEGEHKAFDTLMHRLYEDEERRKIIWAIGCILSGDSTWVQKFLVLYGKSGAGKSTVISIVEKLFEGYCTYFEARELGSASAQFALEPFRMNPLVGIQHDGDLSRIEDNTRLNSLTGHDPMGINEKFKSKYTIRPSAFLWMGTNKPVKITDPRSGLIRRLIDVSPTGDTFPASEYYRLMKQIDFELGSIASYCLAEYKQMGPNYYDDYIPRQMLSRTEPLYNFVEDISLQVMHDGGITLKQAYLQYKDYCDMANIKSPLPMYVFKEDLREYFGSFEERKRFGNGERVRNWYSNLNESKIFSGRFEEDEPPIENWCKLEGSVSIFDGRYANQPAQYASESGTPSKRWASVETTLGDIDTSKLHYVQLPENHIVIDFDLKDEKGDKSLELNLEAAAKWPETYAEISKGGQGLHLHYIYDGDTSKLSRLYDDGIEVKIWTGQSSLRRRLSKCHNADLAHISSGLPQKKEVKKILNQDIVRDEKHIRKLIERNLRKEIHPGTKPSIDFIKHILDEAYEGGVVYDVRDMRQKVLTFAMNSTHHDAYCIRAVNQMKFISDAEVDNRETGDKPIVFFDVEIYPNLFVVCYKTQTGEMARMVNPSASEIESLCENRLIGFNNRRYDNHILYAAMLGYSNERLYKLSRKIVSGDRSSMFREAYNLSYTDVYDFASKKQGLKRWEIELGIHHQEMDIPWDEPCPEDRIDDVCEYCGYDVEATQRVFEEREGDWRARKMLARLSGLTVNDTNNSHSARIIFGRERNPQKEFVYTDLSTIFPGYKHEFGKSLYKGIDPGQGGRVYSEPGIYHNVALLDVESMHPTSIEALNLFGPYTARFSKVKQIRLSAKHGEVAAVAEFVGEELDPEELDDISSALKIVINSVYGLTSASFPNPFKDPRNKDNIVAKRGALFMIDLQEYIEAQGFKVIHVKTDSVKIPDATPEIIEKVMEFGKKYGYTFEHEATYDRICLLNDAEYIAHDQDGWHPTGAAFRDPYTFKTLFSHEDLEFQDICLTKTVKTHMVLVKDGNTKFIGGTGSFCPMKEGGGELLRELHDKLAAVADTKGYSWLEAEMVKELDLQDDIDLSYFDAQAEKVVKQIEKFGSFEEFVRV